MGVVSSVGEILGHTLLAGHSLHRHHFLVHFLVLVQGGMHGLAFPWSPKKLLCLSKQEQDPHHLGQ